MPAPKKKKAAGQNDAKQFKDNENVKTQEEAIRESLLRASAIMEMPDTVKERMSSLFCLDSVKILVNIYNSMFAWRPWRRPIIEQFCKIGFMTLVADGCKECIKNRNVIASDVNAQVAIEMVYGIICTATDASPEASKVAITQGLIPVLISNISSEHNRLDKEQELFISLNLSTIHNIAKLPESKDKFEALHAAEVIKYFFSFPNEKIQISSLSGVACILSDSDASASLIDKNSIIPKLVNCLKAALQSETSDHNYLGFSAEELVESLVFLAVNDDNKEKIADSLALPLLVEMLSSADVVEQGRAVDCLWALAFKEYIRKEILEMGNCCSRMEQIALSSETEHSLKLKTSRALAYIKSGTEGIIASAASAPVASSKGGHVFISYCWKHQDIALKIRQLLVDRGYAVWIDVDDKMHGSTLQSMAQAVENAAVVLICYSEYYKQSNMCRAECEYVFRLGKPFVPISMQYRYQATGWLGIVVGAKLYVDFSLEKHPFEDVVPKLFSEIRSVMGSNAIEEPVVVTTATGLDRPSKDFPALEHRNGDEPCKCCKMMETLVTELVVGRRGDVYIPAPSTYLETKVRGWSTQDVEKWFIGENLPRLASSAMLKEFDGRALLGLYEMKHSAPQLYYTSVLQLVNNSFTDCVHLTAALDKLLNSLT